MGTGYRIRFFLASCAMAFSASAFAFAGTAMVKVPEGEFKSGEAGKAVKVAAFEIDKLEVTNEDYKSFQKDFSIPAGKEKHPVTEVTYFDAEAYCKSVGKRLPTGTEWEKAARGADGRKFPWGNEFKSANANTMESGKTDTAAVGSFKDGASPYGALDMAGNVWEWVDQWTSDEKKYRVVMGGSFFDTQEKAMVYAILKSIPDDSHTYIGFRCAK